MQVVNPYTVTGHVLYHDISQQDIVIHFSPAIFLLVIRNTCFGHADINNIIHQGLKRKFVSAPGTNETFAQNNKVSFLVQSTTIYLNLIYPKPSLFELSISEYSLSE